jgi:hypothetical protein
MHSVLKFLYRPVALWVLLALFSFAAGLTLAGHHPLSPLVALSFFYFACVANAWRPGIWLIAVPACLPWLNFSPWTGWLIFDEFDLLLLAVFAGGYCRLARSAHNAAAKALAVGNSGNQQTLRRSDTAFIALATLLALLGIASLMRGFQDAGGFRFGWFQAYTDPLNSLRVFKSLLFGILTIPLLRAQICTSSKGAGNQLALGMVLGLASVALAALWERAAYPGVFDFSTVYRVTAMFWEMHVGGGAIDAYLAMAMPFVLWSLANARGRARWVLSAALGLLATYACLVTFSRGVYLAVALSLILCVIVGRLQTARTDTAGTLAVSQTSARNVRSRVGARWILGFTVATLIGAVFLGGTLGFNRLGKSERDFDGRMARWQESVHLLDSSPRWLLGLGLGRLPANYAHRTPKGAGEFPGALQIHDSVPGLASSRQFVTLSGPATRRSLQGLFAMTQRVDIRAGSRYRIGMDIRAPIGAQVLVQLCERHLLYDSDCEDTVVQATGQPGQWQHVAAQLSGDPLTVGPWFAHRTGMLSVSVLGVGHSVDLFNLGLTSDDARQLLANGDFSAGLAHWFPAVQYYFLPWHIDSLYLEVLIERGAAGLVVFLALVLLAVARLLSADRGAVSLSPYLVASLTGALLVGTVNSVMDVPRVAFLLWLLIFFALQSAYQERLRETTRVQKFSIRQLLAFTRNSPTRLPP